MKTVVGLYDNVAQANKVKAALQSQGYDAGHLRVMDQTGGGTTDASTTSTGGFTAAVKNFFDGFTDHNDEHAAYSNSLSRGGALLAVTVPDDEAEETADMLHRHGATGIQGDYAAAGAGDVAVLDRNKEYAGTSKVTGEQVIPVVQEDLVVGKREVNRGGVRIYSHIVQEPVTADVTLRDEQVFVDRTAVNRAATEADFAPGSGVIEVSARGEEAVVGKTSRVVEEVRVGKQASERTEQIEDTVRRTEVDVEPVTINKNNRY